MKPAQTLQVSIAALLLGCSKAPDKSSVETGTALDARAESATKIAKSRLPTRSDPPDYSSKDSELWGEYRSNQAAFDATYTGKTIRLTGTSISSNKSPNIGIINTGDGKIFCVFENATALTARKEGTPVNVVGVYDPTEGALVLVRCVYR